jgi:hypothetical protein
MILRTLTKYFQHSLKVAIRFSAMTIFWVDGANRMQCTIPATVPPFSFFQSFQYLTFYFVFTPDRIIAEE